MSGKVRTQNQSDGFRVFWVGLDDFNVAIPEPTSLAVWSLLGGLGLVVARRGQQAS